MTEQLSRELDDVREKGDDLGAVLLAIDLCTDREKQQTARDAILRMVRTRHALESELAQMVNLVRKMQAGGTV